jgi:U4/U6.U5 tri-snRNP-associated protein 1
MSEEIIELSVHETNKLRAELGLAPLRGVSGSSPKPASSSSEVLELTVDATNELRAKLGLKPLKPSEGVQSGKSSTSAFHKPAENGDAAKEVQARLERAKVEREVQKNIQERYSGGGLGEETSDALSWAAKMRLAEKEKEVIKAKDKKKPSKVASVSEGDGTSKADYSENDLEGLNVAHAISDFEAGSTTILTLADSSLLETTEDSKKVVGLKDTLNELQNVELSNAHQLKDGLRQKRQMELGMGRAGGYAGYDDDEFEELGGVSGPSNMSRGQGVGPVPVDVNKPRGFQIGNDEQEDTSKNDMFSFLHGKAISLEPAAQDTQASDFLTAEEYEATLAKKKKKDQTFKKKTKKTKKEKKTNRRHIDDDDEDDDGGEQPVVVRPTSQGLLAELEQTAVEDMPNRKRRRRNDEENDDDEPAPVEIINNDKRSKYDKVMEKGNARTAAAFKVEAKKPAVPDVDDEEPDDAFLHAALAKARRLRKLKEMALPVAKGAEAVAQAVQIANTKQEPVENVTGVIFAIDETREFTRALRAREEQVERQKAKKAAKMTPEVSVMKEEPEIQDVPMDDPLEEEVNMEELAKEVKEDDGGFEGTTANVIPVGRGLSNVLAMLKHTGEIAGKNAKEEMRGRAKDKRTYEDYETLDLKKVVQIGSRATDKDLEFANREITLDYRDEHGRLLTRKEAYRNLCYQFHGHGSNKKNQERKLRQIEREQAETRLASGQVGEGKAGSGSLGALKATQRATGKAFVIHKT